MAPAVALAWPMDTGRCAEAQSRAQAPEYASALDGLALLSVQPISSPTVWKVTQDANSAQSHGPVQRGLSLGAKAPRM